MIVSQAFRAQARSLTGDAVLLAVVCAAFVMALSLATSVPADFADAPIGARQQFLAPFDIAIATYGASIAAVYGSFRYTVDRRNGVVAQRLTQQPRWASLVARVPAAAFGGALVAVSAVVGGHVALAVSIGGGSVDWPAAVASVALGAAAGLWGLGVGLMVQQHLVALFVAPVTLGIATVVSIFWAAGAVWFPLPAMLSTLGFDISEIGFRDAAVLDRPIAATLAAMWILLILVGGATSFLRRDVK